MMKVADESKDLVKRLEDQFHEEGYRFFLAYQSLDNANLSSALSRGPTFLMCDGTESEDAAFHVDNEIRRLLGAEVMQRLYTVYEVKERGCHISGTLLRSRHKQEGEQDGTGQPATRSQSKSEGSQKPQPKSEGRSR